MAGLRRTLGLTGQSIGRSAAVYIAAAISCAFAGSSAFAQDKWLTRIEKDPMTDSQNVVGFLEHDFKQGGKVDVTGQCDPDSMTVKFEYHAKTRADTYYNTQGKNGAVPLQYRLDGGPANLVLSNTPFFNDADINFIFQPVDDDDHTRTADRSELDQALASVSSRLYLALAPQDLRKLLHAKRMLVELPLGGKEPGYVEINLQDPGFRQFVGACKINVGKIDAEIAKRKAEHQADLAAARKSDSVVAEICSKGGEVAVKSRSGVTDNPNGYTRYAALKRGQIIMAHPDAEAVQKRMCSVSATNSVGTQITGLVSFDVIESTDRPSEHIPGTVDY